MLIITSCDVHASHSHIHFHAASVFAFASAVSQPHVWERHWEAGVRNASSTPPAPALFAVAGIPRAGLEKGGRGPVCVTLALRVTLKSTL